MSELEFQPLHQDFGARVLGANLAVSLSDAVLDQVRNAIDTYSLLCFPNQRMSDERQVAFTRQLGEPEPEHVTFGKTGEITFLGTVGNVQDDGTKQENKDAGTKYQKGNNLWHSDSSFRELPSFVSILHAYEVPDEGGATEFASMRTAYATLPQDTQNRIDPLRVVHDYVFSRSQVAPVDPNHAASLPPVSHNLVRTNPANGKKGYYAGSHARSIPGLSGIESRLLLDDLLACATVPANVYSHQWTAGDTIIWDNRCMLHRGTGYDADRWRRRMRQTRVTGAEKGIVPSP